MTDESERARSAGRCPACGGQLTATHMLTKSYLVDASGRWARRLADFVEDVVVLCAPCETEIEGRIQTDGEACAFTPRPGNAYIEAQPRPSNYQQKE